MPGATTATTVGNHLRRGLSAAALALPVAVTFHDYFYSTYRVRGPSMEPTLRDGDTILVRKADFPLFSSWRKNYNGNDDGKKSSDERGRGATDRDRSADRDGTNRGNAQVEDDAEAEHRRNMDAVDEANGRRLGRLLTVPPRPLPGSVVVFRCPDEFPVKYCVKRVVAQEGQKVRPSTRRRHVLRVPVNSLWVEGDNRDLVRSASSSNGGDTDDNRSANEDSCSYGPVSKKLLVGQVERVVWPPSRWGSDVGRRRETRPGASWW